MLIDDSRGDASLLLDAGSRRRLPGARRLVVYKVFADGRDQMNWVRGCGVHFGNAGGWQR